MTATRTAPESATPTIEPDWRRMAGIFGLGWVALFLVVFGLQSDVPTTADSATEIRQYFLDNNERYLAGNYIAHLALPFFLLPFAFALERVLRTSANATASVLGRFALLGAFLHVTQFSVSAFGGSLAVGVDRVELGDSTVRVLTLLNAYAFAPVGAAVGLFAGAAGLSIWLSGVLPRWTAAIGVVGSAAVLFGASWPITGDEQGAVAVVGFLGFGLCVIVFVLTTAVQLLRSEAAI